MGKSILACPKCKMKLTAPEGAEHFRCPGCKTVLTAPRQPEAGPQATKPAEREGPAIGEQLAGYTVTRLIGRGGMGTVYEAIQEGLKRRVALKVLPDAVAQDAAFLTSFKREAQAAAKLNHPNIIQIFDILEEHGYHFFSMEFVDGESLADRLKREGRLSLPDAMDIVAQVAAALGHAYEHMLIHRDIKPSNVLLSERGEAKLADLGLSKSLEETAVGIARGTHGGPVYMAPELARNPQLADCRSDIYALGAMLFQVLTGGPPFPGPTVAELIRQHAYAPFPSARAVVPEIPEAVDALLQKMCAKDPAERFQTHGELLAQIRTLLKNTAIRMPRVLDAKPLRRKRSHTKHLPLILGAVAIVVLAAVAGGLVYFLPRLRARREQAVAPTTATAAQAAKTEAPEETTAPEATEPSTADVVAPEAEGPPKPEGPAEPPDKKSAEAPELKQQEKPPDEPEKKEPAAEPGDQEPKQEQPEAPGWEAQLAQARKSADALAEQNQFGKAIAALDALTKDKEVALELKAAVEEARKAIEARAAKAYETVGKGAYALARAGKLDEARAAFQVVVGTYGTAKEVEAAQAAVAALDAYKEGLAALREADRKAKAAAESAGRRAAKQAEFGKAIEPIQALLKSWKLDEAAGALAKLKFDDEQIDTQLARRKAAVDALIALRAKMIKGIETAEPRIRKGTLRISGFNGDLVGADKQAITVHEEIGKQKQVKKIPWMELSDTSAELLVKTLKLHSAPDQLAIALWLRLLGNEEKAQAAFTRAGALGAETAGLGDLAKATEKAQREAQAARALADAIQGLLGGEHAKAAAALADYRKEFGDTSHYDAHEELLDVAMAFKPFPLPGLPTPRATTEEPPEKAPEPEKPGPEKPAPKKPQPKLPAPKPEDEEKARQLYATAVAAFQIRRFDACRKLLDQLKAKYPRSGVLSDNKLKPSVATMQKAIDGRGETLRVSRIARGAHRTLEKAMDALKKSNTTIEIGGGIYRGTTTVAARFCDGLILRGTGQRRPRFDGGSKRDIIFKLPNGGKDMWIEHLEFVHTKAAIEVGRGCSAGVYGCTGFQDVDRFFEVLVGGKVTAVASALKVGSLSDLTGQGSVFQCEANSAFRTSTLTGCILIGANVELQGVRLTDCVLMGSATLGEGAELSHVTAACPLAVAEGASGIVIRDSILRSLAVEAPKKKEDRAVAASLSNTALYRQPKPFPKDIVECENVNRGRVTFPNARAGDFRLPKDSPLRGKASDKTDLGCRFSPEMIELLKIAKQYPVLLKPPVPTGKRRP